MEVDVNRVAKICERLGSNPVTHLGLSGKELFHSNMLAWLFQQYREPMTEAFGDLFAPDPAQQDWDFEVLREWRNLDLVVCVPGRRPLVVENKTFSLLNEDQLQRYSEDWWVQDQDPALVLLSLGDPGWRERRVDTPAGKRTWKWLSYREAAKRLRKVAVEVNDDFDRGLLERYCDVIDDLVRLSESLASPESDDSPVHLRDAVLKPLREIRLSDGLLKLRTAEIARRIDPNRRPGRVHAGRATYPSLGRGADKVGRLAAPRSPVPPLCRLRAT